MKRVILFLVLISILIFPIVAASSIDDETMNSGDTAEISAKVYFSQQPPSAGDYNKFMGFSVGAPPGYSSLESPDSWGGNIRNPYEGGALYLDTYVSEDNLAEIFGGLYPNESSPMFWFLCDTSRWFEGFPPYYVYGSDHCIISVSLSRMHSDLYESGLDLTLTLTPQNGKHDDEGNGSKSVTLSTTPEIPTVSGIIFDGDKGTRSYDFGFDSNDFEYWTIEIVTNPLPEDVPSGASFEGNIVMEFKTV